MIKRILILAPVVILLAAAVAIGGLKMFKQLTTPKKVHYHAGFQVYIDDKLQDFSASRYMKENPCIADGHSAENEDEQLEKAHLHDNVGNVVHVHRDNAKWSDLFLNIKYKLPKDKSSKVFINGKEVDSIMDEKIMAYDSVVFFVGNTQNHSDKLKKSVKKDTIIKEESKSENCGS